MRLAALQRVCIDHGAFMPSFPFENMSVKELEHAALSPSMLVDRLRNDSCDEARRLEPKRILPFEPSDSEAQSYRCNQPYLVPGGRFLFTKSARNGHIALWDLGNVGHQENWGLYIKHNQRKLCTKYVNCAQLTEFTLSTQLS